VLNDPNRRAIASGVEPRELAVSKQLRWEDCFPCPFSSLTCQIVMILCVGFFVRAIFVVSHSVPERQGYLVTLPHAILFLLFVHYFTFFFSFFFPPFLPLDDYKFSSGFFSLLSHLHISCPVTIRPFIPTSLLVHNLLVSSFLVPLPPY